MFFKYIFSLYLRMFGVGGEILRMNKGPTVGYCRYSLLCLRNRQLVFLIKAKRYSGHSQSYFRFRTLDEFQLWVIWFQGHKNGHVIYLHLVLLAGTCIRYVTKNIR